MDTRSFFSKEQVSNFELGWKGSFNQGRTYAEFAAFHMIWEDMQVRLDRFICPLASGELVLFDSPEAVNCVGGPQPDSRVNNANEAKTKGAEFSVQSLVGENLQIGGFVGLHRQRVHGFQKLSLWRHHGAKAAERAAVDRGSQRPGRLAAWSCQAYLRVEALYRDSFTTQFNHQDRSEFPYLADDVWLVNLQAGFDWSNHNLNLSVR